MTKAEAEAWDAWSDKPRRARFGKLPKPPQPGDVTVLYGKLQESLSHLSDGDLVMTVIESDAWQGTLGERCRELDDAANVRRAYTHEECEKALLYQRLLGKRTYRAARDALCSAETGAALTRARLGFDRPRDHVGPTRHLHHAKNKRLDGVPSEATMSRYRTARFPESERAELYAECFMRLVEEHAAKFPEFREELRVIGFDGSTHKTIYRPRPARDENGQVITDPTTGRPVQRIKGWEGGSLVSEAAPESKRGHGFLTLTGHTGEALPISCRTVRIHDAEVECLLDAAKHDLPRIRALMRPDAIGVSTMDGAFAAPRVRREMRAVGFVENTNRVSTSHRASAERNRARQKKSVSQIEGFANWRVNGLREIFCMCGAGHTRARPSMKANGHASIAVEGECANCGPIHITSGDWRRVQNPNHYVRINPSDAAQVASADLLFGNPLTHSDARSAQYGRNRYAQGEGLHGTAATRWNLFKDRAYYRRINQARLDVLLTYCLMHGLAMENRRQNAQALPLPPPLPAPGTGSSAARPVALAA